MMLGIASCNPTLPPGRLPPLKGSQKTFRFTYPTQPLNIGKEAPVHVGQAIIPSLSTDTNVASGNRN